MALRRWLAALLARIRRARPRDVDLRAPFAELAESWRGLVPEWDVASAPEAGPLSLLRLGAPALPLVERFVEPIVRFELRDTVVVARFADAGRRFEAALWLGRIVAVRCRYEGEPPEPRQREDEAGMLMAPPPGSTLRIVPQGWLMAVADCPDECIAALDGVP